MADRCWCPTARRCWQGEQLTEGLRLRDLGEHRVKDVPGPVRVHQLVGPDLADDFSPVSDPGTGEQPAGLADALGRA